MKQYITKNQWNKLGNKEKEELNKYFNNNTHQAEFIELSIEQMLDFLYEKEWGVFSGEDSSTQLTISTNLANDLWVAVRSILKKNNINQ